MTTEEILKTIGEVPQTKTVWSLMASTASAIGINANKTSIAAEAMRKAIEAANIDRARILMKKSILRDGKIPSSQFHQSQCHFGICLLRR